MGSTAICFNSDLWAHVVGSPEISGMSVSVTIP